MSVSPEYSGCLCRDPIAIVQARQANSNCVFEKPTGRNGEVKLYFHKNPNESHAHRGAELRQVLKKVKTPVFKGGHTPATEQEPGDSEETGVGFASRQAEEVASALDLSLEALLGDGMEGSGRDGSVTVSDIRDWVKGD